MCRAIGIPGHINFAGYSPDGSLLLTTSQDGTAKVWMANDGELVATLSATMAPSPWRALAQMARQVVTASEDQPPGVAHSAGPHYTRRYHRDGRQDLEGHDGVVHSACYSPNGNKIVTSSDDGHG